MNFIKERLATKIPAAVECTFTFVHSLFDTFFAMENFKLHCHGNSPLALNVAS
jgi:hypothetical protein